MLSAIEHRGGRLLRSWNKARLRGAKLRQGAYLLRTNLDPMDPDALWRQYVQLTEVEAAFRALKSELAIRPIWRRIQRRVEAHILVAFLGYCLWVCLKQKLKMVAESITLPVPWRAFAPSSWWKSGSACVMAVISACHRSPNPKSNKLCCFIIWAGICPNSLRPEFIPINFKALVWQTGAVPEKPSRSKSVTYAIPRSKLRNSG